MNYSKLSTNNSTISSFSLSFSNECNQIQWLTQKKQIIKSEALKQAIPSNITFNISSLIYNHEKSQEEAAIDYKCLYDPTQNAFCLVIDKHMKCASMTKGAILNLLDLGKELCVEAIILLINKENSDYVQIIKSMMIVGFGIEKRVNTTVIEEQTYKIMKMSIKCTGLIEEVDF